MAIDQSMHSLFGVSKLSADLLVQEFGRYFGMNTVCFRGGCLTGASQQGVKLHGFLNYLVKSCVLDGHYEVIGYEGYQVRDNIHASDLVSAFYEYFKSPRKAAVYNIGGGQYNSCSVLEALEIVSERASREIKLTFVSNSRKGDHKWWITDCSKFKRDYPTWELKYSLESTLTEIVRRYV